MTSAEIAEAVERARQLLAGTEYSTGDVKQLARCVLALMDERREMRDLLAWLDSGGGLGASVHRMIRDFLDKGWV